MGIKINFFHGQGARKINAEVLNAQNLHCWGSDKDMIFAPTIITLLLLWCYPSLSTQTFRIKSYPKATILCSQKSSISKTTKLHCALEVSPPFRDQS